ncbi:hypothetical protein KUTeg_019081, partial [Tegillarca granosa]
MHRVKQVVLTIWINQIYALPFIGIFYAGMLWRGADLSFSRPSVLWFLWDFFWFNITNEISFYYTHRFSDNFGVMGILDSFHGTDKGWKKSQQIKRHKTIYSAKEMMCN